jgi:hypothetical protein
MTKRLPSDLSAASLSLLQADEPLDKKIVSNMYLFYIIDSDLIVDGKGIRTR